MTTATAAQKKSISSPDELREFPNGRIEVLRLGDVEFARTTFQPGWRWSNDVKPIAGTDSCEFPHETFILSGRLHVVMDDGTELDAAAGDLLVIPPGHDAWVVGDEPCVGVDFGGEDTDYAKPADA
jgi:hypothetical protein